MLTFDLHLDLAMNAMQYNRDLTLRCLPAGRPKQG